MFIFNSNEIVIALLTEKIKLKTFGRGYFINYVFLCQLAEQSGIIFFFYPEHEYSRIDRLLQSLIKPLLFKKKNTKIRH